MTTAGPIAAVGRTERPTVTAYAPDRKVRAPTPAAGTSALKYPVFTLGLAGQLTKDNGKMARDMAWVWRLVAVGSIEENGLRDSRVVTEFDNLLHPRRDTKARGPAVYKTVTAPRLTPTAVLIKVNGFAACGTDTE